MPRYFKLLTQNAFWQRVDIKNMSNFWFYEALLPMIAVACYRSSHAYVKSYTGKVAHSQ